MARMRFIQATMRAMRLRRGGRSVMTMVPTGGLFRNWSICGRSSLLLLLFSLSGGYNWSGLGWSGAFRGFRRLGRSVGLGAMKRAVQLEAAGAEGIRLVHENTSLFSVAVLASVLVSDDLLTGVKLAMRW